MVWGWEGEGYHAIRLMPVVGRSARLSAQVPCTPGPQPRSALVTWKRCWVMLQQQQQPQEDD